MLSFTQEKKPYVIHLSMKKIWYEGDSLVFKNPKNFILHTASKTDTVEVGKAGKTPIAICVDVRKVSKNKKLMYQIGYAFYEKSAGSWKAIRHFGYTERYELLKKPEYIKMNTSAKPAREEYYCQWGEPLQFMASFNMDVYLN
ncbi:MAG: hypothetical protein Fur0041_06340 [Bacteroidia bacterium]